MNSPLPKPGFRKSRPARTAPSCEYHPLEPRLALASLQVIAAGVTNAETLVLQIDGQTVRTWTGLGGNAYAGNFVTLTHSTAGALTPGQVRLAFTNDLYDPVNGIDRNVRVDAIVIDGARHETESPLVYSTGTWKPADGIVPGFRQSEYLHGNGYFQYPASSGGGETLIQIRAAGDEGGERMELQIDGLTVAGFTVTTSFANYEFTAPAAVTAGRVRIAFVNDLWDPASGIDRNLNVDRISINGTVFETESPNVLSTGTWTAATGIQPGFFQSQTLHAEGYFQYEASPGFGTIGLHSSVVNVPENSGTTALTIVRSGSSAGTVTVDWRTVALSATAGQDFTSRSGTSTLLPGETSKSVLITILDDLLVEGDEQFSFTIDNVQGPAVLLAPRTATVTIQDNDAIRAAGTGLLGEYFDSPGFTARFINRTDSTVGFDWGTGAPASGMGADTFSVRWSGQIEPRYSETYTFQTRTDDGVRLWVNNQLVIDRWIDQVATTHSGTIALQAGVFADIRMEYYENGGSAFASLSWSSPRQPLEVIPRSQLYAADPPPVTPGGSLRTQNLYSGLSQPTAIDFSPDGSNLYIAEQRGTVRVVRNGNLVAAPFLDFRDRINGTRDRGLLDIAVHPDFASHPWIYLLYTYDPPQVNSHAAGSLAGPDGSGNRAARMTRVTADAATNFTTVVPNSEVVLLGKNSTWNYFNAFVNSTTNFSEPAAGQLPNNGGWVQDFIATDSESHTIGSIEFGPEGALYVSIGDGTSYNQVDPRTSRVQDLNNLSGKILRVDPVTGQAVAGNPFHNGNPDANRSKVWQSGLRNPFRISLHPVSGKLFIGDVGWTQWEELNTAPAGANFGWPWFEGGNGANLQTGGYRDLPAAQAFYSSGQTVTPSLYALNHAASGINAIVLGDVYTGSVFPSQYRDNVFFADLGQGIVRNIRFNANGSIAEVQTFATGQRYIVQMVQGPDENLYFVDIDDGLVGRWTFVEATASATVAGAPAPATPVAPLPLHENRGAGVVIATIDSGVDPAHPFLAGQLWTNVGEVDGDGIDNDGNGLVDDRHGYDFVARSGQLVDPYGHGTMIAGLLAGRESGGMRGIAPDARLMPLRVLDANGDGKSVDVAAAIRYAVDHGARIVSVSLALDGENEVIREALAWAQEKKVLVLMAAGNDGSPLTVPLARLSSLFDNVLFASALDASGALLPESNRAGDSGGLLIDAPGVAWGSAQAGTVAAYRGTSIATAIVSGTAALAASVNPDLNARQLRQLLLATAGPAGSGSDSSGSLHVDRAVGLATRLREVVFQPDGGRLNVRTTGGDDSVRFEAGSSSISINGIAFDLPGGPAYTHVIIDGRGGDDRLTLAGTPDGNDYGLLRPGYASLTTAGQFLRGAAFESMTLLAGDGNTTLDIHDSAGDDVLAVADNRVSLTAGGFVLQAGNFRTSRIYASAGMDRGTIAGTGAAERLLARPDFTRLIRGAVTVQAVLFDSLSAAMGDGFDTVIFEGSYRDETLRIDPHEGRLDGAAFSVAVTQLEQSTSYGHGGFDQAAMHDGPGRDTVNSLVLNTLLAGPGYDHRAFSFERTSLFSRGGLDHVTIRGAQGNELLESTPSGTRFSATGYETLATGFPSILVEGGGGEDEARLTGSASADYFWASPSMAVLNAAGRALTARQFRTTEYAGNGGSDFAALVDGMEENTLALQAGEATLSGAAWRVRVRDVARLRANSLIDAPADILQFSASQLDYEFERFGDWVVA